MRDGLLSVEKARTSYGVAVLDDLSGIDEAETARLRGAARMSYRVGIDVGGTFTDFLRDRRDDVRLVHKTSSTPDDPSRRRRRRGSSEIAAALELDLPAFLADVERDRARHDGDARTRC